MKLRQFVMAGLVSVAVAACNQAEKEPAAVPVVEVAPAVPSTESAAPAADTNTSVTTVAGNVVLNFPHSVRSKTEEIVDGVVRHTLRVEYQVQDETAIAAALDAAFVAVGYKVKADGLKFVAFGEAAKVRYVISPAGPDLKVNLSSPESKGLVTFIW